MRMRRGRREEKSNDDNDNNNEDNEQETRAATAHLDIVKTHTANRVHTPGERSDRLSTLLIPDVHLRAGRGKQRLPPVVGN